LPSIASQASYSSKSDAYPKKSAKSMHVATVASRRHGLGY
jgi:hypothetical protein